MNKCVRDNSLVGSILWLKEVFDDVLKAKIPDNYNFNLNDNEGKVKESLSLASLKQLIPIWTKTASNYDKILEAVDNFDQAYSRVCWDIQKMKDGDKTVIQFTKTATIDPFNEALKQIKTLAVSDNLP